jgi:hypothetical protein
MLKGLDQFPQPTAEDYTQFFLSFLFGGNLRPGVPDCVRRAYLDLSRTVRGIGALSTAREVKRSAHRLVEHLLQEAAHPRHPWERAEFDAWHQRACAKLGQHFASQGYREWHVGQSQKWLNMSIKYALGLAALGSAYVDHSTALRSAAHAPLDTYIVDVLSGRGAPRLNCAWSRIDDYALYLDLQRWIRDEFPNSDPLDVEFHLYNREVARRRTTATT